MAYEIELKLRYDPIHHDHLAQVLSSRAESKDSRQLQNRYFDTASGHLLKAGCALRIRHKQDEWEQTLKARGNSEGGLFKRLEWNWPVATGELDEALLKTDEVSDVFSAGVSVDALECQFETNFFRQAWHWRLGDTLVEIVLDRGEVKVPGTDNVVPLCEMELELLEGEAKMLWWMAESLCSQVPLWVSDISKAERGYRLAGLQSRQRVGVEPLPEQPLIQSINTAMQGFKRALESALWDENAEASTDAAEHWLSILMLSLQDNSLMASMPRQHLIGPFTELASIASVQQAQSRQMASNEPDFTPPSQYRIAARQWRQQPSFAQQCLIVSKWSWQQLQNQDDSTTQSGVALAQSLKSGVPQLGLSAWLEEPRNLVLLMLMNPKDSDIGALARELAALAWLGWGLGHHAAFSASRSVDQQIEANRANLERKKRQLIALLPPA